MSETVWTRLTSLVAAAPNREPVNATEEELVALFAELRAPLLRYLYSLGLAVSEGEDIVQEAFLALYGHLSAGKPRDNLRGWIFRVGRNLGLKRLRKIGATLPADAAPEPRPGGAENPEELAIRRQQGRAVQAVIAALPDLDRQCLFLRAEGLKYREIALALDVSLGWVALALSRALARLARVAQR